MQVIGYKLIIMFTEKIMFYDGAALKVFIFQ